MANMFANFDMSKVKSMVNKVTNAVMNYTETEAKVRDATNNEPCNRRLTSGGASSTMMMELAKGISR